MPRATQAQPAERIADGVREGGSVWIDLMREGNNRMHRLNRLLIDEADRTQEENAYLFGQFLRSPTQLGDFTSSLVTTVQERGRRRASLTRRIVNDLGEAATETRQLLTRATDAGRETVSATASAGRDVASRVVHEASRRAEDVSESAEAVAKNLKQENRSATSGD